MKLDTVKDAIAAIHAADAAEQARVARWDLDAKQVAKLAEDPSSNRGLKLHFAWPDQPPGGNRPAAAVHRALASVEPQHCCFGTANSGSTLAAAAVRRMVEKGAEGKTHPTNLDLAFWTGRIRFEESTLES